MVLGIGENLVAVLFDVVAGNAGILGALLEVLEVGRRLAADERGGHVKVALLQQQLDRLVAAVFEVGRNGLLLEPFANVLAQRIEGFGLGAFKEGLVVGQDAAAERPDGQLVVAALALERLGRGVVRELDDDFLLGLARLHALERGEDLRQEAPVLDLRPESLGAADGLLVRHDLAERLAVELALVVEVHEVAVADGLAFLRVLVLGERDAELLQLLLDHLVLHCRIAGLDSQLLVLGQGEFGAHLDDGGERESGRRIQLHVRDAREVDGLHRGLLERLGVQLAEAGLLGFLLDAVGKLLLDDGQRHLALAEARDRGFAEERVQDLLAFIGNFGGIGLHDELDGATLIGLLLDIHFSASPVCG